MDTGDNKAKHGGWICPQPEGHEVTSVGLCHCLDLSGRSGHSPQAHEEHEGHEKSPQRDAVPQVVDDDGNVVVQLALLLRGVEDGERVSGSPGYHHRPTSSTTSPPRATLQILGVFFRKQQEPTWYRTAEVGLEGDGANVGVKGTNLTPQMAQEFNILTLHHLCFIIWGNPAVIQQTSLKT